MLGAVVVPSTAFVEVDAIGTVRAMLLTVPGGAPQVARQAPLAIDPYQPELLEVLAPPDPRNLRVEIEAGVQTAMAVVTVIAFVGSIGALANAMLLAVSERRGEIGLRRALGALRRHIWSLIAIESSIIGLLGGVLGLGLGLAAVLTVTMLQGWLPIFDFALAPLAVGLGAAVGVTGGLLPSARAARAVPADALRT
jgi:ABC-type antimicrobial peptide transport system permease subunit